MCNVNCIIWVAKRINKEEISDKKIIEVGSYDVNGNVRCVVELLAPAEYIGADIVRGPGVDIVCAAENLVEKFGKESFDVIISTCALEHLKDWKRAISNIKNICKPNGIILIIVPSNWSYHEHPYDFWRYNKDDIKNIFSDCSILALEEDAQRPSLIYAKIRKPNRFVEKDLTQYQLYSIITNKRVNDIRSSDLQSFYFKSIIMKSKIKSGLIKLGKIIFS